MKACQKDNEVSEVDNLQITFFGRENSQILGFSDSNYANDKLDRKSTTGYIIMMAGAAVIWRSTKQGIITLSSTEAENVALTSAM